MMDILNAFSKCDSVKLYNLIDTAFYFKIREKDGLENVKDHLCNDFSKNIIKFNEDDFKVIPGLPNTISYLIILPLKKGEFNSVAITIKFNYSEYRIAYYIDVIWNKKRIDKLLVAPKQ